jgi:hypothetical protein
MVILKWMPQFLEDSNDLYFIHKADKIHKKITKKKTSKVQR